ncbi:hypothetical protein DFH09DRAFT_1083840 [Mycena vulgaris]|nr:hypothetical protein DFH09DRAFT_1083840 [Mycena vulgaris]
MEPLVDDDVDVQIEHFAAPGIGYGDKSAGTLTASHDEDRATQPTITPVLLSAQNLAHGPVPSAPSAMNTGATGRSKRTRESRAEKQKLCDCDCVVTPAEQDDPAVTIKCSKAGESIWVCAAVRAVRRARHGHGRRFDGTTTVKSVPLPSCREVNQRLHGTGRMTGRGRLPDSRETQVTRQETHGHMLQICLHVEIEFELFQQENERNGTLRVLLRICNTMPTIQLPSTQEGRATISTPKWSEYAKIQMFNIFRTVARQVTVDARDFDGLSSRVCQGEKQAQGLFRPHTADSERGAALPLANVRGARRLRGSGAGKCGTRRQHLDSRQQHLDNIS